MKLAVFLYAALFVFSCALSGQAAEEHSTMNAFEIDAKRPGADYLILELEKDDPSLCQKECGTDSRCKAWTYVKAGLQGKYARCWLKNDVPPVKPDSCCVSGIK